MASTPLLLLLLSLVLLLLLLLRLLLLLLVLLLLLLLLLLSPAAGSCDVAVPSGAVVAVVSAAAATVGTAAVISAVFASAHAVSSRSGVVLVAIALRVILAARRGRAASFLVPVAAATSACVIAAVPVPARTVNGRARRYFVDAVAPVFVCVASGVASSTVAISSSCSTILPPVVVAAVALFAPTGPAAHNPCVVVVAFVCVVPVLSPAVADATSVYAVAVPSLPSASSLSPLGRGVSPWVPTAAASTLVRL